MKHRTGIGQGSYRFENEESEKKCLIGGIEFLETPAFDAASQGDVVFQALCNAISTLTGMSYFEEKDKSLGKETFNENETSLKEVLRTLGNQKITHISLSLEGRRPSFKERLREIRDNLARIIEINPNQIGIAFTTGSGLTGFGKGEGVQCLCIVSTEEKS
ncbi:2-C-methyl-D-erythritol 2,4-cyclodiphosphate synthase [Criblamydia sequanensis]|uniref:2-C-methyl-D-erythritol 2,4-cyclodiphosphate synthase n=1 Tax=Candidatus Criblamydia sequanensis CRIB-18 TaxID=1437425 RepID=A0A090D300_9BACT|nr:2-C-methyl-D-erythritol 2,4-cyclodiphosphate synthase [Criblamydia sequanensis]CDR34783.1 2-C-methyl-D-erythritol 2,4-cyclodiphosphate synthase [Criblamydia sequanensis CRIB-18]